MGFSGANGKKGLCLFAVFAPFEIVRLIYCFVP